MFYIGSFEVFKEFVSCMCPFWANKTRGLISLILVWFLILAVLFRGEIAMNYMCSLTLSLMSITIIWNFHRQSVKFITIHQNQTILFAVLPCLFFSQENTEIEEMFILFHASQIQHSFVVCSRSFLEGIEDYLHVNVWGAIVRFSCGSRSCLVFLPILQVISFSRRHYKNIFNME